MKLDSKIQNPKHHSLHSTSEFAPKRKKHQKPPKKTPTKTTKYQTNTKKTSQTRSPPAAQRLGCDPNLRRFAGGTSLCWTLAGPSWGLRGRDLFKTPRKGDPAGLKTAFLMVFTGRSDRFSGWSGCKQEMSKTTSFLLVNGKPEAYRVDLWDALMSRRHFGRTSVIGHRLPQFERFFHSNTQQASKLTAKEPQNKPNNIQPPQRNPKDQKHEDLKPPKKRIGKNHRKNMWNTTKALAKLRKSPVKTPLLGKPYTTKFRTKR